MLFSSAKSALGVTPISFLLSLIFFIVGAKIHFKLKEISRFEL